MYKKYITKKGKKIGPYYYESIRLKNGKIKTVYLGRNPKILKEEVALPEPLPVPGQQDFNLKTWSLIGICLSLLLLVSLVSVQYTGFVVLGESGITQEINVLVDESTTHELVLEQTGELESLSVTGSILGTGRVKIYLENESYLIYDNFVSESPAEVAGNLITGLAIVSPSGFNIEDLNGNAISFTAGSGPDPTDVIPEATVFTKFTFTNVIDGTLVLGESLTGIVAPQDVVFEKTFVIDTQNVNLDTGSAFLTADGSELYKCDAMDRNICLSSWESERTLVPGELYEIVLGKESVGYAEATSENAVEEQQEEQGNQITGNLALILNNSQEAIIFSGECVDTCSLTGLNKETYNLIIEISGSAYVNISSITYTVAEGGEEKEVSNITIGKKIGTNVTKNVTIAEPISENQTERELAYAKQIKDLPEIPEVIEVPEEKVDSPVVDRGPTWVKSCRNGRCSLELHTKTINIKDETGKYKPFEEVVKVTKLNEHKLNVHWLENDVNITLTGTASNATEENVSTEVIPSEAEYEWVHNFNLTEMNALHVSEVEANKKVIVEEEKLIVEDVQISYEDVLEFGFNVSVEQVEESEVKVRLAKDYEAEGYELGDGVEIDPLIQPLEKANISSNGYIQLASESYTRTTNPASDVKYGSESAGRGANVYRAFIDFNITGIPKNAVVSNITLKTTITIIGDESETDFEVHQINSSASYANTESGNTNLYTDIASNFKYATGTNPSVDGTDIILDLGSTAYLDLMNKLREGNETFSVGVKTNEADSPTAEESYAFGSKDHSTATHKPILNVTFDENLPASIDVLSPANDTTFAYLGTINISANITDPNEKTGLLVEVFGANDSSSLPLGDDLIFQDIVDNATLIKYNWTRPVTDASADTPLLAHFDNRSLYNEQATPLVFNFGTGSNGTITGAEANISGGVLGGSYEFDGTNDKIDFGDNDAYTGLDSTVAFWFRPNSIAAGTETIFDKLDTSGGTGWRMDRNGAALDLYFDSTSPIASGNVLKAGEFVHIAIAFDSLGTGNLFIGGIDGGEIGGQTVSDNNVNLLLGENQAGGNDLAGAIDEFVIYTRQLTPNEIHAMTYLHPGGYNWYINVTDVLYSPGIQNKTMSVVRHLSLAGCAGRTFHSADSWIIHGLNTVCEYQNISFPQDEAILVKSGGNLTLWRSRLTFDMTADGNSGLNVSSDGGGGLNITASEINSTDTAREYYLVVHRDANFTDVRDSIITDAGWSGSTDYRSGLVLEIPSQVINNTFNNPNVGVKLIGATLSNVSNNTVSNPSSTGFDISRLTAPITLNPVDNKLINNTVLLNNAGRHGIRIGTSSARRSVIEDNLIVYEEDVGFGTGIPIRIFGASGNDRSIARRNTIHSINTTIQAQNNGIYVDTAIINATALSHIETRNGFSQIAIFINTTGLNRSKIVHGSNDGGTLLVQWYAGVNVTIDNNASIGAGVNVGVYNITGSLVVNLTTESNGLTDLFNATEFEEIDGTFSEANNYTVNVSKPGFADNHTTINITGQGNAVTIINVSIAKNPNTAPSVGQVSLGPTITYTNDTMFCEFNVSDDGSPSLSANISFFNRSDGTNFFLISSTNISVVHDVLEQANITTAGIQEKDDVWLCQVDPFDGSLHGTFVNSTTKTVSNLPPTIPSLTELANGNVTTNRTPEFTWSASTDPDAADTVLYFVNISCLAAGCADLDKIFVLTDATTFIPRPLRLFGDDGDYYNWTVMATDNSTNTTFADTRNFTLVTLIDVRFTDNDAVIFGNAGPGTNTISGCGTEPGSFEFINDGNVEVNVTIFDAQNLFESTANPTTNYQMRVTKIGVTAPFNTGEGFIAFTNVPVSTTNLTIIDELNYTNLIDGSTREVCIDVSATVPGDERPGVKNATLGFVGERCTGGGCAGEEG